MNEFHFNRGSCVLYQFLSDNPFPKNSTFSVDTLLNIRYTNSRPHTRKHSHWKQKSNGSIFKIFNFLDIPRSVVIVWYVELWLSQLRLFYGPDYPYRVLKTDKGLIWWISPSLFQQPVEENHQRPHPIHTWLSFEIIKSKPLPQHVKPRFLARIWIPDINHCQPKWEAIFIEKCVENKQFSQALFGREFPQSCCDCHLL